MEPLFFSSISPVFQLPHCVFLSKFLWMRLWIAPPFIQLPFQFGLYDHTHVPSMVMMWFRNMPPSVAVFQVEISKCVTMPLLLLGELAGDPMWCDLVHPQDVFKDVQHHYMAYNSLSCQVSCHPLPVHMHQYLNKLHILVQDGWSSCMLCILHPALVITKCWYPLCDHPIWQSFSAACFLQSFQFLACMTSVFIQDCCFNFINMILECYIAWSCNFILLAYTSCWCAQECELVYMLATYAPTSKLYIWLLLYNSEHVWQCCHYFFSTLVFHC
jgi:hypothetical protein